MTSRRTLLFSTAALMASSILSPCAFAAARSLADIREGWRDLVPTGVRFPEPGDPQPRGIAEWRAALEPARFTVLFDEGTEPPGSSPLDAEKRPGVFSCAACDLPLFTSEMKYDSGTGWPSFFTHIPDRLATKKDFKLIWPRTEYHCVRCGGHQGHVFRDGPPPTGERWCNNGLALKFHSASGLDAS